MALFEKPWGNYLLDGLVESIPPTTTSWLPQTIAWQVIAFSLVVFSFIKLVKAIQRYIHNAYRREGLACLAEVKLLTNQYRQENTLNSKLDLQQKLLKSHKQLPVLLKKIAILSFSRTEINQYSAKEWELWLAKQCNKSNFTQHCPDFIYQLSYWPNSKFVDDNGILSEDFLNNINQLITEMSLWIKHHRSQHD